MEYNKILKVLDSGGRSQKWLVSKINERGVNMTAQTMTKYCSNKAQPKIEVLYVIAGILGISPFDLLIEPEKTDKQ